ncbi:L,D-transpeptidase [Leifsonia aquatica]|uniref:L,D-transpeptidase n=1 Tax=Leifsonia aquatica TaxID=144185 RepID=UPI0004693559|nr:L,D-transpeptidase [Leifsonia aquatica]
MTRRSSQRSPRRPALPLVVLAVALLAGGGLSGCAGGGTPTATGTRTAGTSTPSSTPDAGITLTPAQVIVLRPAVHNAVIPELLAAPAEIGDATTYALTGEAPLFGDDRSTPVARLAARDFLHETTTVVIVRTDGAWALALTPARRILPSTATTEPAPAQTAGWVPLSYLNDPRPVENRIEISTSEQRLSILDRSGAVTATFPVGVGTPDTPTPTGVTGYLQARYLDPDQGQSTHRIQLTSLHATASDEPYEGDDGGLIGIHYQPVSSGAISHGCVRMDAAGIDAVDALPLGTLVTIVG